MGAARAAPRFVGPRHLDPRSGCRHGWFRAAARRLGSITTESIPALASRSGLRSVPSGRRHAELARRRCAGAAGWRHRPGRRRGRSASASRAASGSLSTIRERISLIQPSASRGFWRRRVARPSTMPLDHLRPAGSAGCRARPRSARGSAREWPAVAVGRRRLRRRQPARDVDIVLGGDRRHRLADLRLPRRARRASRSSCDQLVDRGPVVAALSFSVAR